MIHTHTQREGSGGAALGVKYSHLKIENKIPSQWQSRTYFLNGWYPCNILLSALTLTLD